MPDVGSSSTITLDPPANAKATDSLLFCPPDKFLEYSYLFSSKLTSPINLLTSSSKAYPYRPLKVANSSICSATVRSS